MNRKIPVTLEMLGRAVSTQNEDNTQSIGIHGGELLGFFFVRLNSNGCDGWTRRYPLTRMGIIVVCSNYRCLNSTNTKNDTSRFRNEMD